MNPKLFILFTLILFVMADEDDINAKVIKADSQISNIKTLTGNLVADPFTKRYLPSVGTGIADKLATVTVKWNRAKIKAVEAYNQASEVDADKISGAIEGVGGGFVGFVNGVKNGDWVEGVQGALQIISAAAQLAGPVGMIVSSILSVVSSLFSLFGGGAAVESMDDKMERIVAEQIDIGRRKNLDADVRGLKAAYTAISTSIQHFRDSGKLDENQANELYNHAFTELPIFGKLRARIDEICDDKETGTRDEKNEHSYSCLDVVQQYTDVSIIRQLIITDMASLLVEIYEDKNFNNTNNEVAAGLKAVGNNLLNLVKQEQEADRTFLGFMGDPFNHGTKRNSIALFYQNPYRYPTLKSYIRNLHANIPGGLFREYTMICVDTSLGGFCDILGINDFPNLLTNPGSWANSITSVYIPLGMQIEGYQFVNYENRKWGPYVGPTVLVQIAVNDMWRSMKVKSTTRDADKEVKICRLKNMSPHFCDTVQIGTHDLENLNGFNWENKVNSMHVPKGLTVNGYSEANQLGSQYLHYSGPITINDVYRGNTWKSIKVYKTSDYNGKDAIDQVLLCIDIKLNAACTTTYTSLPNLNQVHGSMNFAGRVKSMKIPGGFRVTLYSATNYTGAKLGPYSGPITIHKVNTLISWQSLKISRFNTELNAENVSENPPSMKKAGKKKGAYHSSAKKHYPSFYFSN